MITLHHVALGARDVERVAAFYRDVLGLPEVKRHFHANGSLRSIWLDLGGPVLMVEATEGHRPVKEGVDAGWFLLALRTTAEQQTRLEQALQRAGAAVESRTEFTSYARDPEGNRVAISRYPLPTGS